MQRSASHICGKPYVALRLLCPYILILFFTTLFISVSQAETANTYLQWECAAGENEKWICGQKSVLGREYPRPNKIETFDLVQEEKAETALVPRLKMAKNLKRNN